MSFKRNNSLEERKLPKQYAVVLHFEMFSLTLVARCPHISQSGGASMKAQQDSLLKQPTTVQISVNLWNNK